MTTLTPTMNMSLDQVTSEGPFQLNWSTDNNNSKLLLGQMVAKNLKEFKLVGPPVSKRKANSLRLQTCFI